MWCIPWNLGFSPNPDWFNPIAWRASCLYPLSSNIKRVYNSLEQSLGIQSPCECMILKAASPLSVVCLRTFKKSSCRLEISLGFTNCNDTYQRRNLRSSIVSEPLLEHQAKEDLFFMFMKPTLNDRKPGARRSDEHHKANILCALLEPHSHCLAITITVPKAKPGQDHYRRSNHVPTQSHFKQVKGVQVKDFFGCFSNVWYIR